MFNLMPWRWKAQRLLTDRLGYQRPFRKSADRRMLFISAPNPLCHTQLYPFFHHSEDLRRTLGLELRELPLASLLIEPHRFRQQPVDAVCFQTWFDLTAGDLKALLQTIENVFPGARIGYFDWFAPTDLRYASALSDGISVYLKKQTFKNHQDYALPTHGDTNLTDFFARRYGIDLPETHFSVPGTFFDKLLLGPNFCFSPHMVSYFTGEYPNASKTIDVHARIAVKGTEWYTRMRREALDKIEAVQGIRLISRGRVPHKIYFRELFESKLCFSPFGYGEVCWRDYEAAFAGALLLKPNMGHIATRPDIFEPYKTYVPLEWDLSDLEDKVSYYLAHETERYTIARAAFDTVHRYLTGGHFLDDMKPLWDRLLPR